MTHGGKGENAGRGLGVVVTGHIHADVKIHAIDANGGIILQTEINMLRDTM